MMETMDGYDKIWRKPMICEEGSHIINKPAAVTLYAITHFLVDFSCAFLLFSQIYDTDSWYICLLFYNFCAFALQMPFGLLADRLNRNAWVASAGCVLVAAAFFLGNHYIAAAVLAGVGNGLFHVGGGIDVLNISKEKSGALGLFVSPGAFGIFFGTMMGKQALSSILTVLILLAAAVLIPAVICGFSIKKASGHAPVSFGSVASTKTMIALLCLYFVVCMRFLCGYDFELSMEEGGLLGIILVCGSGAWQGYWRASGRQSRQYTGFDCSLGLSAVLFLFSDVPYLGVAAVFFFNMTMPITLWATARIMPGAKGFSFGLLTFGLFLGFAPVYLGLEPLFTAPAGFALASAASLVLLLMGLRRAVKA
jgi:FSR family fosmidomycin resistance protein-like MFS transporter